MHVHTLTPAMQMAKYKLYAMHNIIQHAQATCIWHTNASHAPACTRHSFVTIIFFAVGKFNGTENVKYYCIKMEDVTMKYYEIMSATGKKLDIIVYNLNFECVNSC